jgi:TfoX/Sxy family transcriptional regulator of competence genes
LYFAYRTNFRGNDSLFAYNTTMVRQSLSNTEFRDFILAQLQDLPYLKCAPMFGGWGMYLLKIFFGIIYGGELYVRVNSATQPVFDAADAPYFQPRSGVDVKQYRRVPPEILQDTVALRGLVCAAADFDPDAEIRHS